MSESSAYNSSHRALLQAFMARSTFTYDDAKPVLASILTAHENRPTLAEDITPSDWETYVHTLNAALSPFNYEIRSARPQTSTNGSEVIYAFVNASSDVTTQLATTHSADEVAFIRRVLDAMFETYNTPEREVMAIKLTQGLALSRAATATTTTTARTSMGGNAETQTNGATQGGAAAAASKGLTKDQAQDVLDKLVADGWFARSRAGYLSLDTRGLLELGGWLRDMYNEEDEPEDGDDDPGRPWQRIKVCEGCRQIITVGQRCSESTCMIRLHDPCVTTFFHGQRNKRCPVCKEEWKGTSFVGERAAARDGGVDTSNRRGSRR